LIENYFHQFETILQAAIIVHSSSINYDKRSSSIGFIRGSIYFLDGSLLHLREFVNIQQDIDVFMYAYHYQGSDGNMIFRYDNAPHFPNSANFPHHKHEGCETRVMPSSQPDIETVLKEIRRLLVSKSSLLPD
jgi:hypothetical protein